MTLAEFVLARVDDDEAEFWAACEAEAETLRHDGLPDCTANDIRDLWLGPETQTRWPRWLAECEVKRQIVAWCVAFDNPSTLIERIAWPPMREVGQMILRTYAALNADHPDYQEEWKL